MIQLHPGRRTARRRAPLLLLLLLLLAGCRAEPGGIAAEVGTPVQQTPTQTPLATPPAPASPSPSPTPPPTHSQAPSPLPAVPVDSPRQLTQEELDYFNTEFFFPGGDARELSRQAVRNHALNTIYESAAEISLRYLFYGGGYEQEGPLTGEERELLAEANPSAEDRIAFYDCVRVPAEHMEEVFFDLTGLHLEESGKRHLQSFIYLEEFDAYYLIVNDSELQLMQVEDGWYNEDGTISLRYHADVIYGDAGICRDRDMVVTLRPAGDSYHFVSNLEQERGAAEHGD